MIHYPVLPSVALAAALVCVVGACAPSHVQTGSTSSLNRETRGWLGINIQDFTDPNGALVTDVTTDSPADKGGLERGDVVVSYDGHTVRGYSDLSALVANTKVGTRVAIDVVRDGGAKTLKVKITKLGEPGESTPSLFDVQWGEVTPTEVQALLDQGPDIDERDEEGRTPLYYAASYSTPAVVTLLLDAGADLHARDTGRDYGDGELIGGGMTPLHIAVIHTTPDVVTLLLDRGADLHAQDNDGETILHSAAGGWKGAALVPLLLERGADLHTRDKDGWTILHHAVSWYPHPALVSLLLERGVSPRTRDKDGRTPLHILADRLSPAESVATLLLDAGADVNARTSHGETPLHSAADGSLLLEHRKPDYDHSAMVALLLDRGADIHARDKHGRTPLHQAARSGNFINTAHLLYRNAVIKASEDGSWAMTVRRTERGADINARDKDGWTPLHYATAPRPLLDSDLEVARNLAINLATTVRFLLTAGADVSIRDVEGRRPIDLAAESEWFKGTEAYWQLNDAGYE